MKKIYLDYAAATPLDPRVKKAMEPYWEKEYGNPTSIHEAGRRARQAVEEARRTIAQILNCHPSEIVFTGGGTEAINLAILGVARAAGRGHLITTKIEHHAVLRPIQELEKKGFEVTYLNVDKYGLVNPKDIKKFLRPYTILIAVTYANSEIGTIEPIKEVGKIIKKYRSEKFNIQKSNPQLKAAGGIPFFLVDASQAAGALDLDTQKLGVDLMALNSSKIYGPKGIGALYLRRGIKINPLIYGGGQEGGIRSGTENVPGIVGFAKALELVQKKKDKENARLIQLRDYFIKEVLRKIPDAVLNGHPEKRLPNNINISIAGLEGEAAVIYLSERGVYISTGSTCSSIELTPSHVVVALGRPREYASGSLRFSLGRQTTKKDLKHVLKILPEIVEKLKM